MAKAIAVAEDLERLLVDSESSLQASSQQVTVAESQEVPALCHNIDVEAIDFEEKLMIKHFLECIKLRNASMFPHKIKKTKKLTLS